MAKKSCRYGQPPPQAGEWVPAQRPVQPLRRLRFRLRCGQPYSDGCETPQSEILPQGNSILKRCMGSAGFTGHNEQRAACGKAGTIRLYQGMGGST